MDGLESLDQQIELPFQLAVYLRAYLEAQLRIVLLWDFVVLDQSLNELLDAEYSIDYLFDSFRMSHSNLSSKMTPPSPYWILRVMGIRNSLASLGMSMDEKLRRICEYFLSRVL